LVRCLSTRWTPATSCRSSRRSGPKRTRPRAGSAAGSRRSWTGARTAQISVTRKLQVDALVVVDMQIGLLRGAPKHDLQGDVDRINALSEKVRSEGGKVIWIGHCGNGADGFERRTPGWAFLPDLLRIDGDIVVEKNFERTVCWDSLSDTLARLRPHRVLVIGWATDFCVDVTVRSTVSHDQPVVAVIDAHTLSDQPHLPATTVIAHHNWIWSGLTTNRSINVSTRDLLAQADELHSSSSTPGHERR
jgi:nicotinamidase-related amidase